ncbi:exported protein of unknown function (plasmid) [Ralstonia solanacearum CMR15]|nr:exported protein of unknown function [Ralstonia solanacearum CMR15]
MAIANRIGMACVLVLFAVLGTGCKPSQSQAADGGSKDEPIGLTIEVLNYTDIPIGIVYVNGVWAGNMASHKGGNSIAGSISVPAKWRPDLTVEVEWQDDLLYAKDRDGLYKATVPVESYGIKYGGTLWVAFFPGSKVRVIPSAYTPDHSDFPGGLKYPQDVCMADAACAAEFYPERIAHSQKGQ